MELITPDIGLLFWTTLAFGVLFFALAKFAFPVINKMLKKREEEINSSLEKAEYIHREMTKMQADNEMILSKAREEHDKIVSEARQMCSDLIEEARAEANEEKERIIGIARETIKHERIAASIELKNQVADISIKIAEKILEKELQSDKEQLDYINRILSEIEEKNKIG